MFVLTCQFDPLLKHNTEISRVKGGKILFLQLASFCFTWVCIQYLNFNFMSHSNYSNSSSLTLQINFKMKKIPIYSQFHQCSSKFKNKLKIAPIFLWFIFLLVLFCVKEQNVLRRNHLKNFTFVWFNVINSNFLFGFHAYHITEVNHYNLQINWKMKSFIFSVVSH